MASLDGEQQKQWEEAQSSVILGLDLIAAARSQLRLLAKVDSHLLNLYNGPALQRAIQRYKYCWLPLLAKHGPNLSSGFPLIPPLDCAWVWHCHRLNPVQYSKDCETCYGKLLESNDTYSDTDSKMTACTQAMWEAEFPDEQYELRLDDTSNTKDDLPKKITYDLQAAVERQSSFFYQVSRPHMEEESFLQAALQRYKGFLYLLKLSGLSVFLVPTYDIDLMWHSHQSNPGVYRQDTGKLFGKLLNHDDTDSDRSEGKKLDMGFTRTQIFWQLTFGSSYQRAGAMYRGEAPILHQPFPSAQSHKSSIKDCTRLTSRPGVPGVQARKTLQVFLAVQKVRNLHVSCESFVAVRLRFANKCSSFDLQTSWMAGEHNTEWNDFWALECEEGTGGIRLELRSKSLECCTFEIEPSLVGWVDISWEALLKSSTLSCDGWVPLQTKSKLAHDQKPTSLRISMSITPPVLAPSLLRIEPSVLSHSKKDRVSKLVFDCRNNKSLLVKLSGVRAPSSIEVHQVGNTDTTSDTGVLPLGFLGSADYLGPDDKAPAMMVWSLLDGDMQLAISSSSMGNYHPLVQIKTVSRDSVSLLHGRRCQYNVAGAAEADEAGFMTLLRQSLDGGRSAKATALLNWKSGAMEVSPEEDGILVVLLCTIIVVTVDCAQRVNSFNKLKRFFQTRRRAARRDEWGSVILNERGNACVQGWLRSCPWYSLSADLWTSVFYGGGSSCVAKSSLKYNSGHGGGCGACGAGVSGNDLKNVRRAVGGGNCGGCGAGGCGNNMKEAAAKGSKGGGCGGCGAGGCGNGLNQASKLTQGGGCGGCGAGGCGNRLNQASKRAQGGGCGGCGAGGCGNSVSQARGNAKGGGCGGCGSGGCGNATG